MALEIDTSQPLTYREYRYLQDRGRLPQEFSLADDEEFTDEFLASEGLVDVERSSSQPESSGEGDDPPEPATAADDEEDESYEGWTNTELRDELDEREIDYRSNARKSELIALLVEDDDLEESGSA